MIDDEPVTSPTLNAWTVQARNLPEHARNRIHTDAGGRAAGFCGALVAGVTVYAYLTRPASDAWGLDWVRRGTADVRFRSPVLADDPVIARPGPTTALVEAVVEAVVDGEVRATALMGLGGSASGDSASDDAEPVELASVERLDPLIVALDGEWADYGARAGEDSTLYADNGIVHAAVWPALANAVVHAQLARGSWIHTRSRIRHRALAPIGGLATVEAVVVDRFETRSGERAVLDVQIRVEGVTVARIEHEALVALVTR